MKKNMYNLRKLSLEKKKDENKKNVKSTSDFCTYCKSDELTPYDGYIICKKCGIYWDYEELIWWDKLIFLLQERMEEKRYAQWRNQYWEPPF